jgi:hypothetical protein
MTPEETVEWERENGPRAGAAALAAAFLTILGVLLTTVGQPGSGEFDDKIVTVVDAMSRTAAGQPVPPGRISAYAVDVGQHPVLPILGAVLYGLGSLAIYFAIAYLFRAVRARRPEMQQFPLVLAAVGAVGFGLGRAVAEVARYIGAHNFVDAADKSNSAASDALSPPAALIGQIVWQAAALALGFAFVMIALNAMRVGLLTRFMGVLGISHLRAPHRPAGDHPRLLARRARGALHAPVAQRAAQGMGDGRGRAVAQPAAAARGPRGGEGRARRRRSAARTHGERAHRASPRHAAPAAAGPGRERGRAAQRVEEEEAQAPLVSVCMPTLMP